MDYKMAAYGLMALLLGLGTILVSGIKGRRALKDKTVTLTQRSKELVGHGLFTVCGVALLGLSIGCFWFSLPSNQVKPDRMSVLKAEYERVLKTTGSKQKAMESMELKAKELNEGSR